MFFRNKKTINEYVAEAKKSPDIQLVDVRERDEFRNGHIEGSINVPLSELTTIKVDKNKTLYVFCLSGGRSAQAIARLKRMGYSKLENIGGVSQWKGKLV